MSSTKRHKLIAVDCDGTLFDNSGHPSSYTCETMQRVVDAGHSIVAATGRSRLTAAYRLAPVPGMRYLICSNGSYVWDALESKLDWDSEISLSQVVHIVDRLRDAFNDIAFSWESHGGLGFDDAFSLLAGGIVEMETGGKTAELGSEALYKLKVRRPGVRSEQLQPLLLKVLGDACCEITTSGAPFIEITALGTHKAFGLNKMAGKLGFSVEDTIVFGDNANDLPMFRCAGQAIAMGNAIDSVKAEADVVTLSNSEHGVARYLETLLDTGRL